MSRPIVPAILGAAIVVVGCDASASGALDVPVCTDERDASCCALHEGVGICDAGELATALEAAEPGGEVVVGACRVRGSFSVGPGVQLRGVGRACTTLTWGDADHVVVLAAGSGVSHLSIEQDAQAGCVVAADPSWPCGGAIEAFDLTGEGVTAHDLRVELLRGVGIAFVGIEQAEARDVELKGPITADNVRTEPLEATGANTAVAGLIASDVGDVVLADITARGFSTAGVAVESRRLSWNGGVMEGNAGVGAVSRNTIVDVTDVQVRNSLSVPDRLTGGEGMAFLNCDVRAADLEVSGNPSGGIFHQRFSSDPPRGARYEDVVVRGNGQYGLALARVGDVVVQRLVAEDQTFKNSIGDGLHLIGPFDTLSLRDSQARGNERVGMLIDLRGSQPSMTDIGVILVESSGDALGFVVQNGTLPESSVVRAGAAATNDALQVDPLAILTLD